MKWEHERTAEDIQALVDGELSPEAAARVRSTLLCSEQALTELDECLQMAALAHALCDEARVPERRPDEGGPETAAAPIVPLRPRRQPGGGSRLLTMVSSLSFAAAAAVVALHAIDDDGARDPRDDASAQFASALAPRRPIEARLSWPGADRHRPYDTARAGASGERSAEKLPFDLLARIEKLGDPRAMTAAQVLLGNPVLAAQGLAAHEKTAAVRSAEPRSLVRATAGPSAERRGADADSDRAAIALLERRPEEAVLAAAAALESDPRHVQATWNRALALQRLGMPLTAADAFEAVAARRELGWGKEAADRAAALRTRFERRKAAWKAASDAGAKLVAGGMVDDATVSAYPGLMRRYFYDAVRTAASADRVGSLRPLAEALDTRSSGRHLAEYVDRIARADFRRRAPLAARFAVLARRELTDQAEVQSLIRALRAARQDDILLGALLHSNPTDWRPNSEQLDEYVALAREAGDPWLDLEADVNRAWIALRDERFAFAQDVLNPASALCEENVSIDLPCLDVFRLLTHSFLALHRPGPARRTLDSARKFASATGNVTSETDLLWYQHVVVALRDDTSGSLIAVSSAYLDEWTTQSADCADAQDAREWKAIALINQHRLDDARRVMDDTGACEPPPTSQTAFVLSYLLRERADEVAVQSLRREIAGLRVSADTTPGERAFLDHIEGRLLVDRDPAQGHALLRRAITAAAALRDDIKAVKARSYSYSVLVDEAAARGASSEALDLLAEERGLPAPTSCALGAAAEGSAVFVARADDGATTGVRYPRQPGEPAGAHRVPAAILAALAKCQSVDVFAGQPYYGRPDLLPRHMAWQFRTGAALRKPLAGPGRQIIVANIDPPPGLDLAPLRRMAAAPDAILIEGTAATPRRVLVEAASATFLEIHAHGLLGGDGADTSLLVLAPGTRGHYTLGGADIQRARLRGAPVVVLAACHASAIGSASHSTWGLADAFAQAGARSVIASPDPIQDAGAPAFFAALRRRIVGGQSAAAALREERLKRRDPAERAWIDRLVVFR